jgi:CMP/dCMP kinase
MRQANRAVDRPAPEPLVIAVDGPAASGKSTIAKRIAEQLGLAFLDTGLLYRAVGRRLLERQLDPAAAGDARAQALALEPSDLDETALKGDRIGQAASKVAAHPEVRQALLPFQRRFAAAGRGAVLAGRDVGTVVCPHAQIKLFVTASPAARARRRFEELRRRGDRPIEAQVLEDMLERDCRDQERAVAPLRVADDAWVLDTTELDVAKALTAALAYIERRLPGAPPASVARKPVDAQS